MKYALGNMLNGAGGLNADQLALDLPFAVTKSLTARKGPTPVFTRASSGTFVGSNGLIQSAGNNVARFDHDPVTLASRGLLIEESRTNLVQRSGEYENAYWDDVAGTTCAGVSSPLAPDGSSDVAELKETATSSSHSRGRNGVVAVTGTSYSFSAFIKKNNRRYCGLYIISASPNTGFDAIFDLDTGAVSATANVGTPNGTASIEAYGNGWYRCRVTFTTSNTLVFPGVFLSDRATFTGSLTAFNIPQYTGDANNSVYIWGAQLEAGSFATSYIPTTTASVVRSADVCSISGAGFTGMWNALEGSLFTSAIFNAPVAYGTGQVLIDVNDTTAANRLRYARNAPSAIAAFASTSGNNLNVSIIGVSALQPSVAQKYSVGFKLDDYAFYVNNSQIGTDNLGAMIVSPTTMTIGDTSAGVSRAPTNGTISAIRYYRKRLANAKLQALTV